MKGLLEIQQDNDALVARADAKRKQSLRRLKQRIARSSYLFDRMTTGRIRREINAAIDAWDAAERKRGMR